MFGGKGRLLMTILGKKPRKLRCLAALTILILVLSAVFGVFTAEATDNKGSLRDMSSLQAVYVRDGDTLWGLVDEYYNYAGDIRRAIHEVEQINGIDNAIIQQGEVIYIPVN
jgi:hypothetical protein